MEVWAGHSSCRSDEPDLLSSLYSIAHGHECLAEVEIRGHDASSVIDVDDIAGQEEVVDERDDSAVRSIHRLTDGSPEIDTEVAARQVAIEDTPGSKLAGNYRRTRAEE
jgi:hypothetical protein